MDAGAGGARRRDVGKGRLLKLGFLLQRMVAVNKVTCD